jgi:hypothetical protein
VDGRNPAPVGNDWDRNWFLPIYQLVQEFATIHIKMGYNVGNGR